jgi:hypothetical protein
MSYGPLNANYLKNGDIINIASGFSNYSTNKQYDVMTLNSDVICGKADNNGNNLAYCMACGKCSENGANSITYDVGNSGQSISSTNFTINKITLGSDNNNYKFTIINNVDPIYFGDLVVFTIKIGSDIYAWQTGPQLSGANFNDTVALQLLDPDNKNGSSLYQVWNIVNPQGAQGIISPDQLNFTNGVINATKSAIDKFVSILNTQDYENSNLNSPYYGNPYWIQSFGKAVTNGNYQYVTLNNSGYNCVVSTQDVGKTPSNRGPLFIFTNGEGNIPLNNGKTANVPLAGDATNEGFFGLHFFSTISNIFSIVIYLLIYFIITIVFLVLVYYLI